MIIFFQAINKKSINILYNIETKSVYEFQIGKEDPIFFLLTDNFVKDIGSGKGLFDLEVRHPYK